MSELIGKSFPVLGDGFVRLVDVMGDDRAIVDAARVSYGKGTRKTSQDRDLIRFLYRKKHTSPFEMAEIKLHLRLPMDVARQWWRHRTASINEYSTRYSEAIDSMQATPPDGWRLQATGNKQGSAGSLAAWTGEGGKPDDRNESVEYRLDHSARLTDRISMVTPLSPGEALSIVERRFHRDAAAIYRERIAMGVAREQARKDLPLSTYTEAFWKCDLRNVLGFLSLRMAPDAQAEIRAYAEVIGRGIVAPLFPETWRAFEAYSLGAMEMSATDIQAAARLAAGGVAVDVLAELFPNARERAECVQKLARLGIIPAP